MADLATEQWANAPGDGCFDDCFAAACVRAGFTPRPVIEADTSACTDLVTSGAAVVLAQGTCRPMPGIAMLPITGTPLRWRHYLGWNRTAVADEVADGTLAHATAAYLDTVGNRPRYATWLEQHPRFGALSGAVAAI